MLPKPKKPSFRPNRSEAEKSPSPSLPPPNPRRRTTKILSTLVTGIALTLTPPSANPQGCTQCRDNTAATPPATQRAYRRAIILLTLTAGGLFTTALALFKRHR